jgi:phenylalanine-4-hydroxylase
VQADYTCPQDWASYTAADHDTYRRLYERQAAQLPGLACDAFIKALPSLGVKDRIPRFDEINERLHKATGWEIVAVPGLIPELPFFTLLANRKFPVTDWIRKPEEFNYIVEPDVFHDLFGHVPMLFDPTFADYVQRYGAGGIKAHELGRREAVAAVLVHGGIRLDSPAGWPARLWRRHPELGGRAQACRAQRRAAPAAAGPAARHAHALQDRHLPEQLLRDRDFAQLFELTAPDFTPLYEALKVEPTSRPACCCRARPARPELFSALSPARHDSAWHPRTSPLAAGRHSLPQSAPKELACRHPRDKTIRPAYRRRFIPSNTGLCPTCSRRRSVATRTGRSRSAWSAG